MTSPRLAATAQHHPIAATTGSKNVDVARQRVGFVTGPQGQALPAEPLLPELTSPPAVLGTPARSQDRVPARGGRPPEVAAIRADAVGRGARQVVLWVAAALTATVLTAACATTPTAPAGAPAPGSSSPAVGPPPGPPGAVRVSGAVRDPGRVLTAEALRALPQREVEVSYQSAKGVEQRRERGVALDTIVAPGELATDPSRKNDQLTFAVLAVGADGYQAAVSYGEVSPDFGNRGILVALDEDGRPLPRPRLVVPGDVKGGRYVSDLVELRVAHVTG